MRAESLAKVIAMAVKVALAPVVVRLTAMEAQAAGPELTKALADTRQALADARERIAALEVKSLQPGPAGPPGRDGKDGEPGKPGLQYLGVFAEGKHYEPGDVATWAGSTWHCQESTETRPGETSRAWQLMVKRGRDGRDRSMNGRTDG